jgi:hypothetical protein
MRWPPETIGFASPLKRLQHGDDEICRPADLPARGKYCGVAMGFAGQLKRMRHGNGIHRPAKMIVAWRWDSPAR